MDKSDVSNLVGKLLRESYPNPRRGADIAAYVRATFPQFKSDEHGARNLREFIRQQVPDVAEYGKAGTDVLYISRIQQQELFDRSTAVDQTIYGHEQASAPVRQLLENPRIWKTFVSPTTLYRLFVSAEGRIRVVRSDDQTDPTWFEIKPISEGALLQIARDFVSDLHESQKTPLIKTLSASKWWLPFFEVLQAIGLKSRWIGYRRRRIVAEFEKELMKVPVAHPSSSTTPAPAASQQLQDPVYPESNLIRKIALYSIQHMDEDELRRLSLPLRYVMDALAS